MSKPLLNWQNKSLYIVLYKYVIEIIRVYIHNDLVIGINSCDFPFNMQVTNKTSDLY